MSNVEGGAEGEHNRFAVSRRVLSGAPTPSKLLGLLDRMRHPNGAVDSKHPGIVDIMRQARKDKLDVLLVSRGDGIDAVAGRFIADHHRLIKIGIGVGIGLTAAGAAAGFILRRHKR